MSVRWTNQFWSASLEHTLFLDFLKLFMNMRLVIGFVGKKSYFLDLRIKSYGCLKFQGEVWARRACVGANQQELTTCAKSRGQEEQKFKKNRNSPTGPGIDPRPAGDRWSPASGRHLRLLGCPYFYEIF
jgi:hypothetical protein